MNSDQIVEDYKALKHSYEAFSSDLSRLLEQLLKSNQIEFSQLESRTKDVDSLARKIQNKHYSKLSIITDLCGLRVIVPYKSNVVDVDNLIQSEFQILEHQHHGENEVTEFGYRSLHIIAKLDRSRLNSTEWGPYNNFVFEIQIRTILEHSWALISHQLDYKTSGAAPPAFRRRLFQIAALLETSDELFEGYRKDIAALRLDYAISVSDDTWRDLPFDQESTSAAAKHLRWRDLITGALKLGFRPHQSLEETSKTYSPPGELLTVLASIGPIESLRELEELLNDAIEQPHHNLEQVAQLADNHGFRPFADPATVLAVDIVLKRGKHSISSDAFANVQNSFNNPLWLAVEQACRG